MKLRCLIIDDEFLARQRLLKLLSAFEPIIVVGEARNGTDALEKIALKEPDLIFLDIQMPDLNGFEVYEELPIKPYVIFTTAYDAYAIRAFKINAVDYLLKPFDEDRLEIAINRILEIKKTDQAFVFEEKIKALLQTYDATTQGYITQIPYTHNGRELFIKVDDIIYFKSDGNYVKLITFEKTILHRETMNNLYTQLNKGQYLRIHRSLILNKIYIKNCQYKGNNAYEFELKNGVVLLSARSYIAEIRKYLNE
jgi:two-component system LytT family response regulator